MRKELLPILFSACLCSAVMYIFQPENIVLFSVLAIAINCLFFGFFIFMQKTPKLSAVIYCGVLFVLGFFCITAISSVSTNGIEEFTQYFFGNYSDSMPVSLYCTVIFLAVSFALSSFIFYFTSVIYRSSVVFLTMLIPCVLYAKRLQEIPLIFLILMAALYISVMIHCRQIYIAKTVNVIMDSAYRKSLAVFIILTVVIAVIIPKPKITPFRSVLDSLISNSDVRVGVAGELGKNSLISGGHDYNNALSDNILLNVKADEPLYLRKQVFDYYDNGHWKQDNSDEVRYGTSDWREKVGENYGTFQDMVAFVCEKDKVFSKKYGLNDFKAEKVSSSPKSAEIISSGFECGFYLNTINTIDISPMNKKDYKNQSGEIFVPEGNAIETDSRYTIKYNSESDYNQSVFLFAKKLDKEKYEDFLYDLKSVIKNKKYPEGTSEINRLISDYGKSKDYYNSTYELSSARIRSLALNITQNCSSDLEKALAIQNYFRDNGFKYDLKFIPPKDKRDDIDYFIFESKKGSCSDYATAMTLMAREVGLPARYAEGFMVSETNSDGYYVVRELNAHAFPEVFISGIGWMTFEPTVSYDGVAASGTEKAQKGFFKSIDGKAIAAALLSLILLIAAAIAFMPHITETFFRISLKFKNKSVRIRKLFLRARKLSAEKLKIPEAALSADEVRIISLSNFYTDISALTTAFDRISYGRYEISDENYAEGYENYKAFFKAIKKFKLM